MAATKAAFEAWLAPSNFDNDGRQKKSLTAFKDNNGGEKRQWPDD